MFDFTENITIQIPDVKNQLDVFCESSFRDKHKMIFEVAAIHEGLTSNYNHYGKEQLEESMASWTEPYRKPILINHDVEVNPLGRVMKARMDAEADGSPFIRLQVAITDADAMQRIADERYLTGSVGGKAKSANCSVCETDWAGSNMFDKAPCKHGRGKVYGGKLAYFKLGGLQWKEYSFVNVPADGRSGVLAGTMGNAESDGQIIYPAHIFALDMDNESIIEFNESAEPTQILEQMRKKEARFTYMDLKGTWLSASALEHLNTDENSEKGVNTHISNTISEEATADVADQTKVDNAEEKNMPKATPEQEENVLSVLEELSDHLAHPEEKGDKPEGQENGETELPITREGEEEDKADTEEASDESTDSNDEDKTEDMTEETAAEDDQPDDNSSDGSESEDAADESASGSEEADSSDEELKDEDTKTDESDETDEGVDKTDEATAALTAHVEALTSENDKLKAMLHKVLAERVVDRKIDLKMIEPEVRAEALEEHIVRTAASLADSYKDLSKQTYHLSDEDKETAIADLRKGFKSEATLGESSDDDKPIDPTAVFEDRLVDALMGRHSL